MSAVKRRVGYALSVCRCASAAIGRFEPYGSRVVSRLDCPRRSQGGHGKNAVRISPPYSLTAKSPNLDDLSSYSLPGCGIAGLLSTQ